MAFENLFIRTKRELGGIQLDAVVSENHEATIRTTQNPVEFGVNITDHAVIEPRKLTLVAEVTDTPLGTTAFTDLFSLFSDQESRSVTTYNNLVALMNDRQPIEVQTGLVLYSNMLIKSIPVFRDKNTSKLVRMDIALEEIIITQKEEVPLPSETLEDGNTTAQATSNAAKGRQEPLEPPQGQQSSVLKSLSDWLF